jgi:hypothetical protein
MQVCYIIKSTFRHPRANAYTEFLLFVLLLLLTIYVEWNKIMC